MRILSFNVALQDIRILGASVWRPLEYVRERLAALPDALREVDADIVCLQEVFHRPMQDYLCARLADRYPYVAGRGAHGPKLRLGNELLLLSRYPIDAHRLVRFTRAMPEELLFTRQGFYEAVLNVPGAGACRVINLHASAGGLRGHPEDAAAEAIRQAQVEQIIDVAQGSDPLILAGDLNAGPEVSTRNYQLLLSAGYVDAFAGAGGQGFSWDPGNPLVHMGGEGHLPPQRIDHVFLNQAAAARFVPRAARIAFQEPRVTLSGGRTIPLSDHYGLIVETSGAD